MTSVFMMVILITLIITFSLAAIIFHHVRRENKRKKLEAAFQSMTEQFKFIASKKEFPGNRIISLDAESDRLIYCARINGKLTAYLVHIDKLRKLSVKREYKLIEPSIRYASSMEPTINTISLELHYKKDASPLNLPFYTHSEDGVSMIEERIDRVKKWEALLSQRLKKTSKTNAENLGHPVTQLLHGGNDGHRISIVNY